MCHTQTKIKVRKRGFDAARREREGRSGDYFCHFNDKNRHLFVDVLRFISTHPVSKKSKRSYLLLAFKHHIDLT